MRRDRRPREHRLAGIGVPADWPRLARAVASYSVRTYYGAATEVSEGGSRVLNCYVNAFAEWQIGSEEPVRAGDFKRIPRS